MPKLLIVSPEAEAYHRIITQREPELDVCAYGGTDADLAFAREAEVLLAWRFAPRLLSEMARLEWIQSLGAGVDPIMAARPIPPGVVVTRLVDVFNTAMAEYVLGYLFAITLRVRHVLDLQRRRRWEPFNPPVLRGRTAVVVGLGNIGREVGRTLRSAGLRVIGVSRSGRPVREADETVPVANLDDALPSADFVILVVPLTDESRGLFDSRRLARLPRHAWLLNIGRGGLVHEADLIAALESGTLGGAVLDVFEREPLPVDSPLWTMENVVVTPHIAGPDEIPVIAASFLENYRRYKAGQPLEGVVDVQRGY